MVSPKVDALKALWGSEKHQIKNKQRKDPLTHQQMDSFTYLDTTNTKADHEKQKVGKRIMLTKHIISTEKDKAIHNNLENVK